MAPKKKSQTNAFVIFMNDYKRREESQGTVFRDMKHVSDAAGRVWETFGEADKKPYEMKAQEKRQKDKVTKYTSLGEDLEVIARREAAEKAAKEKMEKYITGIVQAGKDYISQYFYVAHVNHYCFCNNLNKHIPAEIGIVRFSLKEGVDVDNIFNVILDTGTLPMGYLLATKNESDATHLIPPPPHEGALSDLSKRDMKRVLKDIIDFLKAKSHDGNIPPVYVDTKDFEKAKDIFKNLLIENGSSDQDENYIKVYSLPFLFYILRNAAHLQVAPEKAFPTHNIAIHELEKDVYDYVKGISCKYHETTDAFPYCAQSVATRKAYIICDYTCGDLGIALQPGRHVPAAALKSRLQPATHTPHNTVTYSTATATQPPVQPPQPQPQPPPSRRTHRLPHTSSVVSASNLAATPESQQTSNYANNFPALGARPSSNGSASSATGRGGTGSAHSTASGRGRGRILRTTFSNMNLNE